ncbi:MAG: bifunctional (p)ppGpp synthetase/guanosine-3',5'-bis(diphosphate) 3'-pyrophosphohydrolase [Chromatiaceae bacterium]|nr:bifunctional (p)ppGpp synthetase/guanosine-3',5'-bis(diphosphate) 3'-pyrophosphohydrolase [Gammaproteobacteria bacterium]MCP5304677.1 bifunctional (p)ppGpp synthetase/guanosine-3',5'-bis(diphosphate) 3'-pyrophosphohydrolase [Chromatiaceae bacterium]MCP5314404.1 bifunctional (p)ppGpp synthetase/guanosine-3',5'-bis(diphosphate) 3'-pyrophosphohydrolase [Chromatiaceae bacterium]
MVSRITTLPKDGTANEQQVENWLAELARFRPQRDIALLRDAIAIARAAHHGEHAADGFDRFLSLLYTVETLDELKLDIEPLLAAVLSELPGHPAYAEADIERRFGRAVAAMVEQVSRIRGLSASGAEKVDEKGVEKLRRMLLGIADDVRAILVVLAKRLQIMRRLKRLPPEVQYRIAQETQKVHAPIANRLGVWQMKWELEDLCLRHLHPEEYADLASRLDGKRREREAFIADVIARMGVACAAAQIPAELSGRPKHIYSIWKKMRRKRVDFEQVFDVRAVRALVDTVPQCYEVLGIAHSLWRPVPGEFDDYIAHPKPNGYRSLHTAVVGDDGKPLEIQVRTREMHEHAERGVAAHWKYKESDKHDDELERRIAWMRRWLEQQDLDVQAQETADQESEYEARRIYVLSPQGKVVELPSGATALDFAYAIHTSVGHRCRGARVDGHIAPLAQPLQSGQQVEILTIKEGGPSRDWLNPHSGYLTTARARNRIRQWFKQQDHDQHAAIGRANLEREVARLSLPKPDLERLAHRFNFKTSDDLLAAIGRGELSAVQVANAQADRVPRDPDLVADREIPERVRRRAPSRAAGGAGQVVVEGIGDLMTQIAKCCKPVPYDDIVGYITRGRGVTVHRTDCAVVRKMDASNRARLVDVAWADTQQNSRFLVDIQVLAADRKGLLRDISSVFANAEVDVLAVNTQSDRRNDRASMRFTAEVSDMAELSRVIDRLAQIPDVLDVRRQLS